MKKILIIGGGIAGLSAGIYARRSGFDAAILEMHTIPGGNSTSWKRNGFLFEGGLAGRLLPQRPSPSSMDGDRRA